MRGDGGDGAGTEAFGSLAGNIKEKKVLGCILVQQLDNYNFITVLLGSF